MAGTSNLWRRGAPSELASSGAVHFESGEPAADVDVVLYSSGYRYSLPFLDASSRVASIDNRYAGSVGHAARQYSHPMLDAHPLDIADTVATCWCLF